MPQIPRYNITLDHQMAGALYHVCYAIAIMLTDNDTPHGMPPLERLSIMSMLVEWMRTFKTFQDVAVNAKPRKRKVSLHMAIWWVKYSNVLLWPTPMHRRQQETLVRNITNELAQQLANTQPLFTQHLKSISKNTSNG